MLSWFGSSGGRYWVWSSVFRRSLESARCYQETLSKGSGERNINLNLKLSLGELLAWINKWEISWTESMVWKMSGGKLVFGMLECSMDLE